MTITDTDARLERDLEYSNARIDQLRRDYWSLRRDLVVMTLVTVLVVGILAMTSRYFNARLNLLEQAQLPAETEAE